MDPSLEDLLHKVKVISQTSYGTILSRIIDSVYEKWKRNTTLNLSAQMNYKPWKRSWPLSSEVI